MTAVSNLSTVLVKTTSNPYSGKNIDSSFRDNAVEDDLLWR